MDGETPRERLLFSNALSHEHVLLAPVLSMEDMFQITHPLGYLIQEHSGGKYAYSVPFCLGEFRVES